MIHPHIHEEKIVDYVLGELSSEEYFKVNAHLAACKKCASIRDHWTKYLNIESMPIPSASLKPKIFTKISHQKNRLNHKFVYVAVSLCVVFIMCLGIFQLSKPKSIVNNDDTTYLMTPYDMASHEELLEYIHLNSVYKNQVDQLLLHVVNDQTFMRNVDPYEYMNILRTSSVDDLSSILPVHQLNEQIIFINNGSICSYEPKRKKLSCIQMRIDSQTKQMIPIESNTFHFNQ